MGKTATNEMAMNRTAAENPTNDIDSSHENRACDRDCGPGRRGAMSWIDIPMIGRHWIRDVRDRDAAERLASLITEHGPAAFGRDPAIGHVTGSAFILSPDRSQTLLLLHAKLGRWFQPGGHCDGDTDVHATAWREAVEETGLPEASITPIDRQIFDIDIHEIPARASEPAHLHYDVRFLFEADPSLPIPGNAESTGRLWVALSDLERYSQHYSVLVVRQAALK